MGKKRREKNSNNKRVKTMQDKKQNKTRKTTIFSTRKIRSVVPPQDKESSNTNQGQTAPSTRTLVTLPLTALPAVTLSALMASTAAVSVAAASTAAAETVARVIKYNSD